MHRYNKPLSKYFIKHAQGISTHYNTTTGPHIVQSRTRCWQCSLAVCYAIRWNDPNIPRYCQQAHHDQPLVNTNSITQHGCLCKSHNTNEWVPQSKHTPIQYQAQQNLNNWSAIVHCTGGANPSKCQLPIELWSTWQPQSKQSSTQFGPSRQDRSDAPTPSISTISCHLTPWHTHGHSWQKNAKSSKNQTKNT